MKLNVPNLTNDDEMKQTGRLDSNQEDIGSNEMKRDSLFIGKDFIRRHWM